MCRAWWWWGVAKRGDWMREAMLERLAAAGMREEEAFLATEVGRAGTDEGSSSSTITQFRRSSSASLWWPVCRRLGAGRSGVVSGDGCLSWNGFGVANGFGATSGSSCILSSWR